MHHSLIIGASGGIGSALHSALSNGGSQVSTLSRSQNGFDITDEASVQHHLSSIDQTFDMILVATGALEIDNARPEKALSDLTTKSMLDQFALNTIGPAMVLKHALPLLPKDRRAVMAVVSARIAGEEMTRSGISPILRRTSPIVAAARSPRALSGRSRSPRALEPQSDLAWRKSMRRSMG